MLDVLPDDVVFELKYQVGRAGLEYATNFRGYRESDDYLRREFEIARRRGQYLSFETRVVDNNGEKWMVGCNYGD